MRGARATPGTLLRHARPGNPGPPHRLTALTRIAHPTATLPRISTLPRPAVNRRLTRHTTLTRIDGLSRHPALPGINRLSRHPGLARVNGLSRHPGLARVNGLSRHP
ncbi:hypothetical protein, partial [Actinoplanes palleronii]|uniref:hypothetical protein n=1 Tax=Actinoplanes palleronii TaxID=113570 RepID=UPI0019441A93